MKYMAAYLLAVLGGDKAPSADKITEILDSVGIAAESDRVNALIKALEGKNLDELISEGAERLSTVVGAGGGAAAGGAAPAGGDDGAKEEEKAAEEEEDEESEAMEGMGLFGSDDSDSDSD